MLHKTFLFASRRGTLFCLSKIKYPNKTTPRYYGLTASLRYSTIQAAAELALSALRQSSPKPPELPALLGVRQGIESQNHTNAAIVDSYIRQLIFPCCHSGEGQNPVEYQFEDWWFIAATLIATLPRFWPTPE